MANFSVLIPIAQRSRCPLQAHGTSGNLGRLKPWSRGVMGFSVQTPNPLETSCGHHVNCKSQIVKPPAPETPIGLQ